MTALRGRRAWEAQDFEDHYRRTRDPWSFATEPYERSRFASILDHVPPARYRHAVEPGCSTGELTVMLADRVESVDAFDVAPTAVAEAERRCAHLPGVTVRTGSLLDVARCRSVDLIVLSEVAYYLDESVLFGTVTRLAASLAPQGRLIASHWIGRSPDHVLAGERAHEIIAAGLPPAARRAAWEIHTDPTHDGFVLETWDVA
jgi:trans-aconitate methyltransferase